MKKWEKSNDFRKIIRKFRIKNRLTQEEAAESIDCSDKQIRNIESGKSDPKLSTAMLLCEKYGIDLSELGNLLNHEIYSMYNETYILDGNKYIGYGIKGNGINFEDISVNFTAVQNLAVLCNRLNVDSVHMQDIVEDFLCEGL